MYKEQLENYKGDKRSREYKELKKLAKVEVEAKSEGLGDTIEKVLRFTGVKQAIEFVAGKDCLPCDERRKALNAILPYGEPKQVRWFTSKELSDYEVFIANRKNDSWSAEQVTLLFRLYAEVFNRKYNIRRMCGSCMGTANILKKVTLDLDKVYNESTNN